MALEHQETMGAMLWAEICWGVYSVDKSFAIETPAFKAVRAQWEVHVCAYANAQLSKTPPPGSGQGPDPDKMTVDSVTRHCMRELGMAAALYAQDEESTKVSAEHMQKAWVEAQARNYGGMGGVC